MRRRFATALFGCALAASAALAQDTPRPVASEFGWEHPLEFEVEVRVTSPESEAVRRLAYRVTSVNGRLRLRCRRVLAMTLNGREVPREGLDFYRDLQPELRLAASGELAELYGIEYGIYRMLLLRHGIGAGTRLPDVPPRLDRAASTLAWDPRVIAVHAVGHRAQWDTWVGAWIGLELPFEGELQRPWVDEGLGEHTAVLRDLGAPAEHPNLRELERVVHVTGPEVLRWTSLLEANLTETARALLAYDGEPTGADLDGLETELTLRSRVVIDPSTLHPRTARMEIVLTVSAPASGLSEAVSETHEYRFTWPWDRPPPDPRPQLGPDAGF
jgi:hypothetical protein